MCLEESVAAVHEGKTQSKVSKAVACIDNVDTWLDGPADLGKETEELTCRWRLAVC